MTFGPDPSSAATTRLTLGLGIGLLTAVLVLAAQSRPDVEDARIGRRVELMELIGAEQARVAALSDRVELLAEQLAEQQTARAHDTGAVAALRAEVAELAAFGSQTPVRGPGVTVQLTDSPLRTSPSEDLNDLVIHEQDLQAVINALWAGGAEAMTVQGERVLATTAIRCVGNTLLLHGAVYSPPYVIQAVGDPQALRDALDRDVAVERFRTAVARFQLGYSVSTGDELELPRYDGALGLQVARPAEVEQG